MPEAVCIVGGTRALGLGLLTAPISSIGMPDEGRARIRPTRVG